ncbi:hypothetical protein [Photobacterium galatheae]|uniref:Uncharacterized protein n=1 Tax=Photobacterium galatheae TaxID=1654360 RepID=A0A066RQT0_9GAMM|nr:hypothetical protein [Photobacterium galatheae]KDM89733.1 hypothetical protein EA58_21240 [Photobacterium galatheae]MCM0151736.1 hypothetical protein [Photobacterium galatheae]
MVTNYLLREVEENYNKWDLVTQKLFEDFLQEIQKVSENLDYAIDAKVGENSHQNRIKFGKHELGTAKGSWLIGLVTYSDYFEVEIPCKKIKFYQSFNDRFWKTDNKWPLKKESEWVVADSKDQIRLQNVTAIFLDWISAGIEEKHIPLVPLSVRASIHPVGFDLAKE